MPLFNQHSPYINNDWKQISADYSIVKGDKLIVNAPSETWELSFPTNPMLGEEFEILTGMLDNTITINLQGHKVNGNTKLADVGGKITNNSQYLKFIYLNVDFGWLSVGDRLALKTNYYDEIIKDEPWAYLRLNETFGTLALGESNNRHGTYYGNYESVDGSINFENNKAIRFVDNGYISFSQIVNNPSQFTLECRFNTLQPNATLFAFGDNQQTNSSFKDRELILVNGKLRCSIYQGNNFCSAESPQSYNDGEWHTVTTTCSARGIEVWVDSNLVSLSEICNSPANYSGYWHIGYSFLGGYSNNTQIDEVSIFLRALSPQRIIARHLASLI